MRLTIAVIAVVILLSSTGIITSVIYDLFIYGSDLEEYNRAKQVMSSLDTNVRASSYGENAVVMNFHRGSFEISDQQDIMKYIMAIETEFETAHEGNLIITASSDEIEIMLNYSGTLDIVGNVSTSGGFILALEKIDNQIRVEIP